MALNAPVMGLVLILVIKAMFLKMSVALTTHFALRRVPAIPVLGVSTAVWKMCSCHPWTLFVGLYVPTW
jgi:hypothetical protein